MLLNVNTNWFKQDTLGRVVVEDALFDSTMLHFQEYGQTRPVKLSYNEQLGRYTITTKQQCREWYCMHKLGFKRILVDI